jgi:hypothetical protein
MYDEKDGSICKFVITSCNLQAASIDIITLVETSTQMDFNQQQEKWGVDMGLHTAQFCI